ncbi:DsbA family protein [Chitinophaga horti]|uniref:DsbA family protein n=1 Tax=Chitinophaga horti TaxID=2920382 RepID=A0ABY6J8H6_9BACT|nr:DsbA family protein [Chitinophaga horti]UYQ95626.1 DsbA family protein [Chitinophaga horti]
MELKEKRRKVNSNPLPGNGADRLALVLYTDPLCCWSWAFTQILDKWRASCGHEVTVRYVMGGMLADWKSYQDEVRAVTKPIQMGPVWLEARQMAGIQLDDRIWFNDPPASSYPACVAVKAAGLQSGDAGERYLRAVQQAVMTGGKNIAKKEVLLSIAAQLPDFDTTRFANDLQGPEALAAFKADLAEVASSSITRFPSLVIGGATTARKLMLTGYRPMEALEASIKQLTTN